MADDWITTNQAAEISGYNIVHLRRLIQSGKIAGKKFGHMWQVDRQSLLDYMEAAVEAEDTRWGAKGVAKS